MVGEKVQGPSKPDRSADGRNSGGACQRSGPDERVTIYQILTGVASSHGVSSGQGDDLLVVEAVDREGTGMSMQSTDKYCHCPDSPHPVKDVPQVILSLGTVGQPAIGGTVVVVSVDPTGPPGNDRTSRFLHGTDTTEGPQVSVGDPRELLLDLLHVVSGDSLQRHRDAS